MNVFLRAMIILPLLGCASANALQRGPYFDLSSIEQKIKDSANILSGGDATFSVLNDSSGARALTEGVAGADFAVQRFPSLIRRNIYALKIAKGGDDPLKVDILVTGTHHAREWISGKTVLEAATFILSNKNQANWAPGDARFNYFQRFPRMRIKRLTDDANLFFVPVVNPQGYQYSFANDTYPFIPHSPGWRKNRRETTLPAPGDPLPALNSYTEFGNITPGVDLNRNYPTRDAGDDGMRLFGNPPFMPIFLRQIRTSRWRTDEIYCGRPQGNVWTVGVHTPTVSEVETDAISTLIKSRTFRCVVDVHSYGGDIGWAEQMPDFKLRTDQDLSDLEIEKLLATQAASLITDPLSHNQYVPDGGPYPTSGDILQMVYDKGDTFNFLIEIGNDANYRPSGTLARISHHRIFSA